MTTSLSSIEQDIVDEFDLFEDWQEKYGHIIELGRELPAMDSQFKDEDHKVKGCQSQVWLHADLVDGHVKLQAESDALIVQGLIALLLRVFDGQSPKAILDTELAFMEKIGLTSHLSMNRTNGLNSMIKQIKTYALAFAAS